MKFPLLLSLSLCVPALAGAAEGAHVHGAVTLDIAVEARAVTIQLASPLDNLVGFEHAPRSEAQKKAAAAAIARLKAGAVLFRIDPKAGCTFGSATLESAALGLGGGQPEAGEHAELDGTWQFACTDGASAGFVELGLVEAFKGVRSVQAQVVTPHGQFKRELKRPATRLVLTR